MTAATVCVVHFGTAMVEAGPTPRLQASDLGPVVALGLGHVISLDQRPGEE
jgi:hypothetical protein